MRKKAEKRTPIVDKKTVHTTMAVFVKAMVMLSVIVAIFFAATPVLAANTGSQSTISTTVPDSHNIRVEKSHAIVAFEDEETRDEEGISDNFVVDRFAEPKIQITPEEGWKVSRILLNGEDVTEQFKDGYLTLEEVCEDTTLVIETAEDTSGGESKDPDKDKDQDKDKDPDKIQIRIKIRIKIQIKELRATGMDRIQGRKLR